MKLKVAFLTTRGTNNSVAVGDCIVITFDENFDHPENRQACIVIDGGRSNTKEDLEKYLKKEEIKVIDLMVATHVDNDHIYGLYSFVKKFVNEKNDFTLLNYWGPAPKEYDEGMSITTFAALVMLSENIDAEQMNFIALGVKENEKLLAEIKTTVTLDKIRHPSIAIKDSIPQIFKNMTIDILAPDRQIAGKNIQKHTVAEAELGNTLMAEDILDLIDIDLHETLEKAAIENNRTANNQSIVFKMTPKDENGLEIEDFSFLFTGDAEEESWEEVIRVPENRLKSKFLKVSHHGSETGTQEKILKKIKPDYSIICNGNNTYGLPDKEILKLINKKKIPFFCTGRNPNEAKDNPCHTDTISAQCPRWDSTTGKPYDTSIVIEIDTAAQDKLTLPLNECPVIWKDID